MATRLELHEKLCTLLGSNNCYYEPPETLKLSYPCFIYDVDSIDQKMANNHHYLDTHQYAITYISKKKDLSICERFFESFPTSHYDRKYVADNLWHYVFTLTY